MAAKFDTTSFIGALKNGGARTNLMWCKTAASGISGLDTAFPFLCKASNIPGSTITALEVPYFGRNVKIAGESREFAPLTTIVVNDEDLKIYKGMYSWFEKFNGAKTNKAASGLFGTRSSYTCTVSLEMYKKDGSLDQKWDFYNAWPSNVSAIDLNWDSVNTIQEFTIDWQYDYYLHGQAKIDNTV